MCPEITPCGGTEAGLAAKNVRLLAFHLPQFHPLPENDVLWGKGFTEWSNVTKARPLFRGHYQPHLPTDLGFYDLRVPATRKAQADMAREHGIFGFCYYHYWFLGRRLMHEPIDAILSSGEPDFPFCFCWANESWTKKWDGLDEHVLVRQEYSEEDDLRHIRWLANAFRDRRYVRVNGKPLLAVYRALRLPNPLRTTSIWREEARRLGLGELYLCRVECNFPNELGDPSAIGFDAAIEFQPDTRHIGRRIETGISGKAWQRNAIFDYGDLVQRMLRKPRVDYRRFPCVTPGWDNSPRRKTGAVIIKGSTPELYGSWLENVIRRFTPFSEEENFVFINAWNEWAEGNHLEPDDKWGRANLEATYRALQSGTCKPVTGIEQAGFHPVSPDIDGAPKPPQGAYDEAAALFRQLASCREGPARSESIKRLMRLLNLLRHSLLTYNVGTLLADEGDLEAARAAYQIVAVCAKDVDPDLTGKAYYKLAQLSPDLQHRRRLLRDCLRFCPGHEAAARLLRESEPTGDAPANPEDSPQAACAEVGGKTEGDGN